MGAAELKAAIEAFGWPGAFIIFVFILLLKNGGLKTIFRDEPREDLAKLRQAVSDLTAKVNAMATDLAVLKDRSERNND